MIWAALAFGSLAFYGTVIGWLVLMVLMTEWNTRKCDPTKYLVGGAIFLTCFSDFNVFMFLWENIGWTLLGIGGYGLMGCLWGTFKWRLLCGSQREDYDEAKQSWLENLDLVSKTYAAFAKLRENTDDPNLKSKYESWAETLRLAPKDLTELPQALKPIWTHWCVKGDDIWRTAKQAGAGNLLVGSEIGNPPKANQHKSQIMTWISYWVFSMAFFILRDPLKWFGKWAYKKMVILFNSIGNRAFRGVDDDFVEEDEEVVENVPE